MPELPEVEVTRLSLSDRLTGARVTSVKMGKPLRWPLGQEPAELVGKYAGAMARRGKYLWLPLMRDARNTSPLVHGESSPHHEETGGLLIHLGMSGSLNFREDLTCPIDLGAHEHFQMLTTLGTLTLTDPRRFGAVVWSRSLSQTPALQLLQRLGQEPLSPTFNSALFVSELQRRKSPIKTVLLSGEVIVGAGNIYASEALFRARIHPMQRSNLLTTRQAKKLLSCVQDVLREAIAMGGSTLRDFRNAHGHSGDFQKIAQVYDREGEPCPRCQRPIFRIVQQQRASYFCERCQPL